MAKIKPAAVKDLFAFQPQNIRLDKITPRHLEQVAAAIDAYSFAQVQLFGH